ncbi:MAG: DUF1501 domain-containing protein [Planctomycetes bacterium]|nr:DUF1501 domain-containing protein [Planctomycetota bacterium]
MLELSMGSHRLVGDSSRRDVIRIGSLGLAGITLPRLLESRANGAATRRSGAIDRKNVIVMWMQGGPSHIDSFDPKPSAPGDIRGEFSAIATRTPGCQVSEHLPRMASRSDLYSIIRSGYSYNASHGVADAYMLSGWRFNASTVYPTYGSVVSRELGYRQGLPPFVQLGTSIDNRFNGGVAGYAGAEHNPFLVAEDPSKPDFSIDGLSLPGGMTADRFARRERMLDSVDRWRRQLEASGTDLGAMNSYYEKAAGLVTSPKARQAFDLSRESDKLRERYGRTKLGQSCLLARRLVEAGVRLVTVTMGGWDTHANNFKSLKGNLLPTLDNAYATLLEDLSDRGLLEDTLVVWLGDFGRTPKINSAAGRDHWAGSTVFCMGGGGVRTGLAVGRSDPNAEQPATDRVEVEDIAATLYHLLGIDTEKHYVAPDGRPFRILVKGRVLGEILDSRAI